MADCIAEGLWRLDIPLEGNPLKNLNSYLIRGERSLLIDTGFRWASCRLAMERQLEELKVDRDQMAALVELLNRHFTGISIKEMNQKLMAISQGITPQLFLLLSQTVNYAVDVLEESNHREFIMAGTNQLLKLPEFRDADKAHQLMSFLSDSKENLPVPDEGPMKILIGPENVSEALQDTSVVVASYDIGNDMRGLIGVVGPTRMDYGTVAARLSGFAEGLTRLFGKQELPPKEDAKE